MTVQAARIRGATPTHRYIAAETALAVVINIFMAGAVTAMTNRADAFNGAGLAYVASDMAKATVLPILAIGVGLTLVTRKRLGTGVVASLTGSSPFRAPRNVVLRALLLAAIALIALGAPATLVLYELGAAKTLTPMGLMLFKLAYGTVIGLAVTPIILALALRDRPAVKTP